MNRDAMLARMDAHADRAWDVLVVGGGATGLGIAVDAAARGHDTLLLEQADFASGTSSRSTKLVHGGVRYLAQGDIGLVLEALRERGLLMRNAPHLVRNRRFIIPAYTWWEGPFYSIGMKVYDAMAGRLGLGPSEHLSRDATLSAIPNLHEDGLRGGVVYHDGQFDDARLAVSLAQTAVDHGALVMTYMPVTALTKEPAGMVSGVRAVDAESRRTRDLRARVVINATGVFVNHLARMDDPAAPPLVTPSQGVHLVLPKLFLKGEAAIMIPHTEDGRVLFAVPWHGRVIIGTTDTPVAKAQLEPRALEEEVSFLLRTAARYLTRDPTRRDVLSVFAGLRPLAAPEHAGAPTREISRGHRVLVAPSGLITIVGGKWTTYRKMAEDAVNQAQTAGCLEERPCPTEHLPIHGACETGASDEDALAIYGTEAAGLRAVAGSDPGLSEPLHPDLPYTGAQVVWACREEMARTVEDVLARRTRALILDARASVAAAPRVAALMAAELGRDADWQEEQVHAFTRLADGYILD